MERTTLSGLVLKYLMENGTITSMEAIQEFGATRLSAIIYDLKKKGYMIDTTSESSKNRYGNSVTYAKYVYKGKIDSDSCEDFIPQ